MFVLAENSIVWDLEQEERRYGAMLISPYNDLSQYDLILRRHNPVIPTLQSVLISRKVHGECALNPLIP